jgi:hypothetical protein
MVDLVSERRIPFQFYERIGDLRLFTDKKFPLAVGLILDGFIEDADNLDSAAIKKFAPTDTAILVMICGTPDLVHLVLEASDERTLHRSDKHHDRVGGEAANTIAETHHRLHMLVVMDPSTIFTGDAISPALKTLEQGEYSAVGWRGGLVNIEDGWRSVDDKGNGDVDVLFSYFMALNVEHALGAGGFNAACHLLPQR